MHCIYAFILFVFIFQVGSWRPDGQRGAECIACPPGASCSGKLAAFNANYIDPPYPDERLEAVMWAQSAVVHESNLSFAALEGYPWPGRVEERDGTKEWRLDNGEQLPQIFFSCDNCKGGARFECQVGHTDRKCFKCAEGWASMVRLWLMSQDAHSDCNTICLFFGSLASVLNVTTMGSTMVLHLEVFLQLSPFGLPSTFSPGQNMTLSILPCNFSRS